MKERYLRSIRLLAECYHAFEQLSNVHARKMQLTPAQFDIIATLGNTPGMTFKELGEQTLITKGTLTGVIDRLEARGLVARITNEEDRRSTIVKLTDQGDQEFQRTFPPHIQHCKQPFLDYTDADYHHLEEALKHLKVRLDASVSRTGNQNPQ